GVLPAGGQDGPAAGVRRRRRQQPPGAVPPPPGDRPATRRVAAGPVQRRDGAADVRPPPLRPGGWYGVARRRAPARRLTWARRTATSPGSPATTSPTEPTPGTRRPGRWCSVGWTPRDRSGSSPPTKLGR